jgi:hypothetical protein
MREPATLVSTTKIEYLVDIAGVVVGHTIHHEVAIVDIIDAVRITNPGHIPWCFETL